MIPWGDHGQIAMTIHSLLAVGTNALAAGSTNRMACVPEPHSRKLAFDGGLSITSSTVVNPVTVKVCSGNDVAPTDVIDAA